MPTKTSVTPWGPHSAATGLASPTVPGRGEPPALPVGGPRGGQGGARGGARLEQAAGAVADPARQLERHAHHDLGHAVGDAQRGDGARVADVAGPWQHAERMRRHLGLVREREADRLGSDIEAECSHRA